MKSQYLQVQGDLHIRKAVGFNAMQTAGQQIGRTSSSNPGCVHAAFEWLRVVHRVRQYMVHSTWIDRPEGRHLKEARCEDKVL